jgi:hypothetical protein
MARKKTKTLPARKAASRDDDSLLMRSAESLGRVIGSLQRQVQNGAARLSSLGDDTATVRSRSNRPPRKAAKKAKKTAARRR